MGLMGLMGCSDDSELERRQHVVFEAQPCATAYEEESPAVTRAWSPPSGYSTYTGTYVSMFAEQMDLFYKSIEVYFTQVGETPLQGTFFYNSHAANWRFMADMDLSATTYYLYGYIPKEVAESSEIAPNSSYSDGAVLTISGLKTVTHSDVSVIVGAKNGTDADNDNGLTTGDFEVAAKATSSTGGGTGNHIFLLFDHLYSALRFNFKMDATYAELRTIKLTKLELTALDGVGGDKIKAKYNVTITLKANTTRTSPIQSVVFTPDASSADVAYEPIYQGAEVALSATTATDFMGCFVPGQNTSFKLRSTYNVYDRQGNLIREGCEAVNDINIRSIFQMQATQLLRGHMYTINMTVNPTYLYVLSEPDLDNPTVNID